MKCNNCNKKMKKSYRIVKGIDNIKQCVECYWLISFYNGHYLTEKKMTKKIQEEIFKKIREISKEYPECICE